jgi:hypothetical protein
MFEIGDELEAYDEWKHIEYINGECGINAAHDRTLLKEFASHDVLPSNACELRFAVDIRKIPRNVWGYQLSKNKAMDDIVSCFKPIDRVETITTFLTRKHEAKLTLCFVLDGKSVGVSPIVAINAIAAFFLSPLDDVYCDEIRRLEGSTMCFPIKWTALTRGDLCQSDEVLSKLERNKACPEIWEAVFSEEVNLVVAHVNNVATASSTLPSVRIKMPKFDVIGLVHEEEQTQMSFTAPSDGSQSWFELPGTLGFRLNPRLASGLKLDANKRYIKLFPPEDDDTVLLVDDAFGKVELSLEDFVFNVRLLRNEDLDASAAASSFVVAINDTVSAIDNAINDTVSAIGNTIKSIKTSNNWIKVKSENGNNKDTNSKDVKFTSEDLLTLVRTDRQDNIVLLNEDDYNDARIRYHSKDNTGFCIKSHLAAWLGLDENRRYLDATLFVHTGRVRLEDTNDAWVTLDITTKPLRLIQDDLLPPRQQTAKRLREEDSFDGKEDDKSSSPTTKKSCTEAI